MGLKYKNCEIEPAPIGRILAYIYYDDCYITCNSNIGYFSIIKGKKIFKPFLSLSCKGKKDDLCKWAYLPEFKEFDKEKPPIGKEVICAWKDENMLFLNHFLPDTLMEGQSHINIYRFGDRVGKFTHWLEYEAFDEEK